MDLRTDEVLIGTASGIVKSRTVKRKMEEERWNTQEALSVKGTPWDPTPGTDPNLIPAAVRRPPAVGEETPTPPAVEPGLGARRTTLRRADCLKFGFTEGCPACRSIERDGDTRKGHNEICRARMEAELMKTEEGRQRVEGGYGRVADAAMRIHEREEIIREVAEQARAEAAQEEDVPRKRPRDKGSTVGQAPGPDDGSHGIGQPQDAQREESTPIAQGTSQEPKPTGPTRGVKRNSEDDDEARYFIREDELPDNQGTTAAQPAQSSASESASASADMPVDSIRHSTFQAHPWIPAKAKRVSAKCESGEVEAMEGLEAEGRINNMETMRKKHGCHNDLSEVYSPPRIVTVAQAAGLRGGFSLDLTAPDPDGYTWDFSKASCRTRALEMLRVQKPYLLIGSPPCTAYSNLQNLNRCRQGGNAKVDAAQQRARVHLIFCCTLYNEQLSAGRYFLHEHPKSATSWSETCMEELSSNPLVMETCIDQCAYGLMSRDKHGEAPAKKPLRFPTNSTALIQELGRLCPGCKRHVQLVEGRAKAAQHYPKQLCRAVTRGIVEQARMDSADVYSIVCEDLIDGLYEINHIEHEPEIWKSYWDDISGEKLDRDLTIAARREEIRGVHDMKVYKKVPIKMCISETGKRPIGTRWVDTNKGDKANPKIRSRLVAQELNRFKCPELFAATPPLEFIRYIISRCASSQWSPRPTRIMINDVKKAYFNAPATRRVFVALPPEDRLPGEEDMCALLLKSLYGTRDAAFNWTEAYTNALIDIGFAKGESSPCSFYHSGRGIATVVHGDDFCSEGPAKDLEWLRLNLLKKFEIKTEVLGPDGAAGEVKELRFLNRVIRWTEAGITWEADPRHAELVIQQLGLEGCHPVVTPGVRDDTAKKQEQNEDDVNAFQEHPLMAGLLPTEGVECALAFIHGRSGVGQACNAAESCDCSRPSSRPDYAATPSDKPPRYPRPPFQGSALDWAPRTDEIAQEKSCYPQDAIRQAPNSKPEEIHDLLISKGWCVTDIGNFVKIEKNVTEIDMPLTGRSGLRVVRDLKSGRLIDELAFNERTTARRLKRQLKMPTDIRTEMMIDEVNEDTSVANPDDVELVPKEASLFRAISARINFLAQDRSDLQFASKECSRRMSSPRVRDWLLLKRIGRYLAGKPRAVMTYYWQDAPSSISVYADSDWAGCKDTRKKHERCMLHDGPTYDQVI